MKHVMQKALSIFTITLLGVLTIGVHSSAFIPQSGHAMGGMNHGSNSTTSCITMCTLATFHKDDYLTQSSEDDEKEPRIPYYAQFQSSPIDALKEEHGQEARLAIEREPPPGGLPVYIALTVFRA